MSDPIRKARDALVAIRTRAAALAHTAYFDLANEALAALSTPSLSAAPPPETGVRELTAEDCSRLRRLAQAVPESSKWYTAEELRERRAMPECDGSFIAFATPTRILALIRDFRTLLSQADAARRTENERCAKIADAWLGSDRLDWALSNTALGGYPDAVKAMRTVAKGEAKAIASAIRALPDHLPATPTEGT